MKTKKLIIIILAALIIAGLVYRFWPVAMNFQEPPFVVEAKRAEPGLISKEVSLLANVKPLHQTVFIAQQNGRMKDIFVQEGTDVSSGTILAELENDELSRAFKHAEVKTRIAKDHYNRILEIFKQGSQSKASLEKAQDEWLRAEIEFETIKERLKDTQFIMPFDGVCGIFKSRIGQTVKSGETIVSCYDVSQFILDIDVPETILSNVRSGQKISYKGLNDKIGSVQNIIDPETRMGIARAVVPNTWPIAVGQLISLDLTVAEKRDVITVPKSAVFIQDGNNSIYVIEDEKAMPRQVTIGIESQDHFEILEGLKVGDTYILKGQENLWPTRAVKIAEEKETSDKE